MVAEQKIYDFRHQVTNFCNWRCGYCLNEGLPIGESRGGIAPETPDLSFDQTLQLYGALFQALPDKFDVLPSPEVNLRCLEIN